MHCDSLFAYASAILLIMQGRLDGRRSTIRNDCREINQRAEVQLAISLFRNVSSACYMQTS
jgi:hypothetical protein